MRTTRLSDLWCNAALACVGWLYMAFAYTIVEFRLPHVNLCPYALLTGSRCLLCGSTRFIGALLHGHLNGAQIPLAGPLWFAVVVYVALTSTALLLKDGHFAITRRELRMIA